MRPKAGSAVLTLLALFLSACGGQGDELSGADLADEIGCFACHDSTDTEMAPTLNGVWGDDVLLDDGRTVVVDEAYVRRAITDPQSDVAAGYTAHMPTFGLSESEVDRLVEYVRSLR
jgi:cytochrome c oxidase subunit 2